MKIDILASGSSGNAYLVHFSKAALLLEAGISFRNLQKLSKYTLSEVDACFITHEHKDHSHCIGEVLKSGIESYMSRGTKEALNLEDSHRLHIISAHKKIKVGSIEVYPFEAVHDAREPFSYLFIDTVSNERLLFFTDTSHVKYKFSGVTHMLAECNYSKKTLLENFDDHELHSTLASRITKSHLSLESLAAYLRGSDTSKLEEIHLIHLSDKNSNEAYMKTEIMKTTGARVIVS